MRKRSVVKKTALLAVLLSVLLMLSVTACSYAKPGQAQSAQAQPEQDQPAQEQAGQAQSSQDQPEQAQPAQEQAGQAQTAQDQPEQELPETSAMTDTVLDIVTPYYLAGGEVAQDSPEVGRDYTDHKLDHALMVRDKTLETGRAIWSAIQRDNLGDEAGEGEIALHDQIDWTVLEAAALFHDTPLCDARGG